MIDELDSVRRLKAIVGSDGDVIARIAAPLWARYGRALGVQDLAWARAFGGEDVPMLLWQALLSSNAITGKPPHLRASGLAQFVSMLADVAVRQADIPDSTRLVWTLPARHPGSSSRGVSVKDTLIDMILQARKEIVLVSPYVDPHGVGAILDPLVDAFGRHVKVLVLTHDALNLSSLTSRGLEVLRRDAARVGGTLLVYSGEIVRGQDREFHPLLHAKLVIIDRLSLLVGSANLTSYAFSSNFEAGTVLGPRFAEEAYAMTQSVIDANLAYLAFAIGQNDV